MTVKDEAVDNHIEHIINFRRRLHREPELSFEEFQTTNLIENGLGDTRIKFHELSEKTGLIGVMEQDPGLDYIGGRADMDALPVTVMTAIHFKSEKDAMMHECGYDIHTSVVYG